MGAGTVNEAESAIFTISADITREENITVNYSVSSGLFETISDSIVLFAGSSNTTARISIDIPDNETFELSNFVTVVLMDDEDELYLVDPTQNEDTVIVLNDDIPQISIEGEGAVTEGENAQFVISSDIAREENLIIRYNVSNHIGDFLSPRQPRSDTAVLIAGAESDTKTISIETHNDLYLEEDGEIQITLVAGTGQANQYTIDPRKNSANMIVRDDGDRDRQTQVTLSLTSSVTEINEGDLIPITLTSDIDPIGNILISYSVYNTSGNFYFISNGTSVETNFTTLEFSDSLNPGEFVASFMIQTRAVNQLDEDHGTITITLNSTADYNISPFEDNTATVTVYDQDIPELSIEETLSVTAPDLAILEVYSDIEPWQPLTVEFSPQNQIGNFLDTTNGNSGESRTAELEFTESTILETWVAQLSIATIADEEIANGAITVTIEPADSANSGTFTINASANESTVFVSNLPVSNLYFVEDSLTVSEADGTATLVIATTFGQSQILNVQYIPTNTIGDFLDETDGSSGDSRTIQLSFELAESTSLSEDEIVINNEEDTSLDPVEENQIYIAELTIPIRDANEIDEEDGVITIEIIESLGYTIDPSLASVAEINVEDTNVPELSLSTSLETIAGGVSFIQVTSDIEIRKVLDVYYTATNEIGDFLDETNGESGSIRTVPLEFTKSETASVSFASFPLTINYSDDFDSGRITIELSDDIVNTPATYSIAKSASTTTIEISRGSIPELAIVESSISVNEGEAVAEILIEASIDPERALWVSYIPENTIGDFLANSEEDSETTRVEILQFTLNSELGGYSSILEIPLRNVNGLDEEDGSILVNLATPTREAGYSIDETRTETVITVKDTDAEPYVNIADVRDVEIAEQFLFEVSLTTPSRKDISIDFETSQITAVKDIDFENVTGTLTIPAGQISSIITVNIIQDRETELEEYFSVLISNPVNAQLYKFTAVGVIRENEKWQISLSATYTQITEGEDAQIVLSSNLPILEDPLTVYIGVQQIGDLIRWRLQRFIRMTGSEFVYVINTKDNVLVDPGKSILLRLVPGKDYDIKADANQVMVEVLDNDSNNQSAGPRISPSSVVANALLENLGNVPKLIENHAPIVTINAVEPIVNEGGTSKI